MLESRDILTIPVPELPELLYVSHRTPLSRENELSDADVEIDKPLSVELLVVTTTFVFCEIAVSRLFVEVVFV